MRVVKLFLIALAMGILILLTWLGVSTALMRFRKGTEKRIVGPSPPAMFPMVVIVNGRDPHFLYQRNLAGFLGAHPDFTFLIPAGMDEKSLNAKLNATSDEDNPGTDQWFGSVKSRRIAADRQELELSGWSGEDYPNSSAYEARPKEIVPHWHQYYFGPGAAMASCLPAAAITLGIWAVIAILIVIRTRRRSRSSGADS